MLNSSHFHTPVEGFGIKSVVSTQEDKIIHSWMLSAVTNTNIRFFIVVFLLNYLMDIIVQAIAFISLKKFIILM